MAAIGIKQSAQAGTASGTSVTATLGVAALAQSRLVAFVSVNDGPTTQLQAPTSPTGWTALGLAVQATGLGPSCECYTKIAVGGETAFTAAPVSGTHSLTLIVYELTNAGLLSYGTVAGTIGTGVDEAWNGFSAGASHTSETQGQVAIIGNATGTSTWQDDMALVFEALSNTGGAASMNNSWVLDQTVALGLSYSGHLAFSLANSVGTAVTITWTTGRPNSSGLIVSFFGATHDRPPDPVTRDRRQRGRYIPRNHRYIPRMFAGTPMQHPPMITRAKRPIPRTRRPNNFSRIHGTSAPSADLSIIQAKRRRNFRRDRPSPNEWFDPTQAPAPPPIVLPVIVPSLRRRGVHERRGTIIFVPPAQVILTPPGIVLDLIRARQRPRFKYTQRHGLFVYPFPFVPPPSQDPRVIEPIRGFLISDGKTTGLLISDGHTTGVLLSDGKTSTVLLT